MAELSNVEAADKLSSLVKLDIDAVHAYNQAIAQIDLLPIKEQMIKYRQDHERHIEHLSKVIIALGVTPPTLTQDFKGYLIEGFTALRSMTGTEGALKAMKTNEELTNKKYRESASLPFSPNIKALIERNYQDEQAHLKFVEEMLANRPWAK